MKWKSYFAAVGVCWVAYWVLIALGVPGIAVLPLALLGIVGVNARASVLRRRRSPPPLTMLEEAHEAALADMGADKLRQAQCRHDHVEDVNAGGERVARLCTDCDLQLAADFLTPAERPTPVVTAFSGGGGGSGGSTSVVVYPSTSPLPTPAQLEANERYLHGLAGNVNSVIRQIGYSAGVGGRPEVPSMWGETYQDGILMTVTCQACGRLIWSRVRVGALTMHEEGCPNWGLRPL